MKLLFRTIAFQVHMWAGLILGIYAFLIGVTGSVLVFREPIVELISPTPVIANEAPHSVEAIRDGIQSSYPGWQVWSLEFPSEPGRPWSSYVIGRGQGKQVFADSQGNVVGERSLQGTWFGVIERFHSNLFLPKGRLYNGIFGLALMLVALTGLILWWPSKGAWGSSFRIVRTSNWKGVVYDLHRVGGAISLLFVVLFSITGGYFTWPAVYRDLIAKVLPVQEKKKVPTLSETGPRKPVEELVAAARTAVPDGQPLRVLINNNPKTPVSVVFFHGGHPSNHRTSTVMLNGHTGEVVNVEAYANNRAGDLVARYIPPAHTGHFGGLAIQIIWAVAGLALPVLFITGFLIWCNRVIAPRVRGQRSTPAEVLSLRS